MILYIMRAKPINKFRSFRVMTRAIHSHHFPRWEIKNGSEANCNPKRKVVDSHSPKVSTIPDHNDTTRGPNRGHKVKLIKPSRSKFLKQPCFHYFHCLVYIPFFKQCLYVLSCSIKYNILIIFVFHTSCNETLHFRNLNVNQKVLLSVQMHMSSNMLQSVENFNVQGTF
jgi:hypothetical protein